MVNRVNKRRARKAYNNGQTVLVFPCNLRPDFFGVTIQKSNDWDSDFDKKINEFEFYNCSNSETGRYAGFILA